MSSDYKSAIEIRQEVRPELWKTPLPLELVNEIQKTCESIRQTEAQKQIARIGRILQATRKAGDVSRSKAIAADIDRICKELGIESNSPVLAPYAEDLDWIQREELKRDHLKEFKKSCLDLKYAIEQGSEWWHIKECYRESMKYKVPLPDAIQQLYDDRSRLEKSKKWAVYAGVILTIVFLTALMVWLKMA